ncbi:hypothetical protein M422DRAFT_151099 [Sphaerobolus stellatus SS14]|nr:hypothetical protein M422DRAFT_151099 [Sphaerobolus stellatus SS14]
MFNAPRPGVRYGNTLGSSFVDDDNPLSSSAYDGLDPWSAAPSPVTTPPPPAVPSVFSNVIADATAPPIYNKAFLAVDPTFSGEVSVSTLTRVLNTSSLPASTVDRIINLVSSRPRVSKLEFFIALALVALAQSGKGELLPLIHPSIEQVAALASQNTLPEPSLNLSALTTTPSIFRPGMSSTGIPTTPAPQYSSDDPWTSPFRTPSYTNGITPGGSGAPTSGSIAGGGMPPQWWKKQDTANVVLHGQQGFLLNRYMVYAVSTTVRGEPVHRRYSEFSFLWDGLVRRYPFRLLPALPPKRVNPDANFLEQRRRGLARWLAFVINHPVIKEDGLLSAFLTEPAFEEWRKHTSVTLEEESASKRIDRVEEMTIPSDLDDKLNLVRSKLAALIDQWQRICLITERLIKRRESAGADLARLTATLNALVEGTSACWRGSECELCTGVQGGCKIIADHTLVVGETADQRARAMMAGTLEALKSQRDLYVAARDLFVRHDRLSGDQVERIKKRVESSSQRLEAVKAAQKEGWQDEADKIVVSIEKDQAAIASLLSRRVFIRHCMWHEVRVVLHNRENTLITQATKIFAREERDYSNAIHANWISLEESLEVMPLE